MTFFFTVSTWFLGYFLELWQKNEYTTYKCETMANDKEILNDKRKYLFTYWKILHGIYMDFLKKREKKNGS